MTGMSHMFVSLLLCSLHFVQAQPVDTVRVGSQVFRSATLRLGADTVDGYQLNADVRTQTSTTIRTISRERLGDEEVYVIRTLHWATGRDTSLSMMTVRAVDFSLVNHKVKASHDSAAVTASRSHLTAWVVLPGRPVILTDRVLERPVFPVEGQIPWLFPMLSLATGYRAAVPHFSQWEGEEVWTLVEVIGLEKISVAGQEYECWKVDAGPLGPPGYRMVRWIDTVSRRVIQSALRGEAGGVEYWSFLRP